MNGNQASDWGLPTCVEHRASWVLQIVFVITMAVWAGGCSGSDCARARLDPAHWWYGDNRQELEQFLSKHGTCAPAQPGGARRITVFSLEETVIHGDLGAALVHDFLANERARRPLSWRQTSPHLSAEAVESLETHCPVLLSADPLPTRSNRACATAILCIYRSDHIWNGMEQQGDTATLCSGAPAWSMTGNATPDILEPKAAWAVALQVGYSPQDIRDLAAAMFERHLAQIPESTMTIGHVTDVEVGMRVIEPMRALITAMHDNGFEVWISSTASQHALEGVVPAQLGIDAQRVIGVRPLLDSQGRIAHGFEGCGGFVDGTQELINHRMGKRCFLNKIAFGMPESTEQITQPSATEFAAGSLDGDLFLVQDAQHQRLVINANELELMCHAYGNEDGAWLIEPQFISPLPQREKPYACDFYGMPEQTDTVFCRDRLHTSESCGGA